MRSVPVQPIDKQAFAPFGTLATVPTSPGRDYFDEDLGEVRGHAWPSLSLATIEPTALPLVVEMMERHEHSSQSFIPLGPGRFLVLVAPPGPDEAPDMGRVRAFLVGPGQAITYKIGAWHHPMMVLDRRLSFAITMWRDGTGGDEELVPVEPFRVVL